MYSALTYDKPPLAGIVALSTWLPLAQGFPQVSKHMNIVEPLLNW